MYMMVVFNCVRAIVHNGLSKHCHLLCTLSHKLVVTTCASFSKCSCVKI